MWPNKSDSEKISYTALIVPEICDPVCFPLPPGKEMIGGENWRKKINSYWSTNVGLRFRWQFPFIYYSLWDPWSCLICRLVCSKEKEKEISSGKTIYAVLLAQLHIITRWVNPPQICSCWCAKHHKLTSYAKVFGNSTTLLNFMTIG